jgi:ABC-type oligopeptide transport system ATPase subunit
MPLEVTISDMSGRVMMRTRVTQANASVEVADQAAGMYLITLSDGQTQRVQRLVIQ